MNDRTRELECVISDLKQQVRDADKVRDDLLEALKALLERYVLAIGNEGIECLNARAAIAKATGEQP